MKERFDLPSEVSSERLVLKPVEMQYAQAVFEVFTDEVTEHMFPATPKRVEDTQEFIRTSIQKNVGGKDYTVFIFNKETSELIGGSGLHHIDTSTPELGIWIKVAAHGHKYGREAVTTLKEWADANLDYDYLIYPVAAANTGSRKIAESLGGVQERSYKSKNQSGIERDFVEYKIYRGAKIS